MLKSKEYYVRAGNTAFKVLLSTLGAVGAAAIGTTVGASIASSKNLEHLKEESNFTQYIEDKTKEYQNDVINGDLTFDDYNIKVNDLKDYNNYIKNDATPEQIENYQAYLKAKDIPLYSGVSGIAATLITGAAGIASIVYFYQKEKKAKYEENIENIENE